LHAVVFDIDGTLLQSAEVDDALYQQAVRSVLGDVQIRSSLAEYRYVSDSGILAEIFADNHIPIESALVDSIKTLFVEALKLHVATAGPFPEIPGARNILRIMTRSLDHSIAIATGGWRASALLKLESSGFGELDIPLATSDDAEDRKEIMKFALAYLGRSFDSVTYYGDGPWDRDAARELGWQFVPVGSALGGLQSYNASLLGRPVPQEST